VVTYGAASSACEKGQRWAEVWNDLQQWGNPEEASLKWDTLW
jgi:hypothetical protein